MMRTAVTRRWVCAAALAAFAAPLAAQRAPDRSKPPAPGPAPALHLPAIEKLKLSNGLAVWIVEQHEVPVVQVNLVLETGSADDPPGKFGVASLAMAMLTEGAGARSALEIADAVDFLGADLGAAAGIDASAVRLHVPAARLAAALPIMADVALRPTFPPEELERQRDDRLTDLLQARDNPQTIGALAFARVLFGPEHRFGTATVGTAATIAAFTADDLRAFYRSAMQPGNATLIVVGDVTPATAMPLLESAFGAWKSDGAAPAHRSLPAAPQRSAREVYIVDKPGAPQSQIRIGAVGVARSTP
ncbi:MAG TPA: pitrilysin family protein, partial [Gammaproteobacteria bacterium]|nr:pitrilysin family protein [Gammaproteobacteria bacterium]